MKKILLTAFAAIFVLSLASVALAVPGTGKNQGFYHGIVVSVDGTDYYLAGAPDGPDGATDVPGHDWIIAGKKQ